MNKLKMIINLILGKKIVVYNNWTKEIICIIGDDKEVITKRYNYEFVDNEPCIEEKNGKVLYIEDET